MIYIERVVTIKNNEALIDEQIILYKGDRNVEVQFTLKNNPFKDKNRVNITYGQLIINRDNASSIFSDISETINGKVLFVITGDMIDELNECGDYDFQIRLFNEDKSSRATLMPVIDGITIREPLCEEEDGVNSATVNYSKAVAGEVLEVFDEHGSYNKTTWVSGDVITDSKLNKIEEALYQINDNIPTDYVTEEYVDSAIANIDIPEVDLSNYATKNEVNDAIGDINAILDAINGEEV